ncbi:MAG: hypothetical protein IPP55_14595 [Anaerolineales bacterium]|nr:hypothetical protein [Anaerolineales bacterium]
MENLILISIGLVVALILLIGIGITFINLKDVNRDQRSGSIDERRPVQPPNIQSKRNTLNKKIEFGELTDIKQSSNYPEDSYVEIKSTSSQTEHCPICRQALSKGESVACQKCNSRYHVSCFREINNTCQNCKWVQP